MMELAIIENLQREDLNAIEEAESYKKLMEDLNITQQEVAERLSKSRPYIANMLRLLKLPSDVAKMVRDGELCTWSHITRFKISTENEINSEKSCERIVECKIFRELYQ